MEMLILLFLMFVAFGANFFSVVTGGAGLVMTPIMITLGFSPVNAIANTKFSYLGGALTGTIKFHKEKKIDYNLAFPLSIFAVVGALIGSIMALYAKPEFLKGIIGTMMLGVLCLVIFNRKLGENDVPVEFTRKRMIFGGMLILVATALGTLAGGGLVVLLSYILVIVFGESFLHSAGTQKILNDFAFLIIIGVFVVKGAVDFTVAIPLLIASSIGAWFGATYGISKGAHWVKHMFMVVIILLSVKLLIFH